LFSIVICHLRRHSTKKVEEPEKFNNYKFADYKLYVIDLILKVSTVSIETMKIINEMSMETE